MTDQVGQCIVCKEMFPKSEWDSLMSTMWQGIRKI